LWQSLETLLKEECEVQIIFKPQERFLVTLDDKGKRQCRKHAGAHGFGAFGRDNVTLPLKTSRRNKAKTIHIEITPIDGRNKSVML
jgi:hypothetical protein